MTRPTYPPLVMAHPSQPEREIEVTVTHLSGPDRSVGIFGGYADEFVVRDLASGEDLQLNDDDNEAVSLLAYQMLEDLNAPDRADEDERPWEEPQ